MMDRQTTRNIPPRRVGWIRDRWASWLSWKMQQHGVSQRELARCITPNGSRSDYRAVIRAWLNRERTIEPQNAFRVGEAMGQITDVWISGPVAVLIAGHYHDFMLLLQNMLSKSFIDGPNSERDALGPDDLYWFREEILWGATYLPFLAEVEIFQARGFGTDDAADIGLARWHLGLREDERVPRKERFFLRSLRHARTVLSRENLSDQFVTEAWNSRCNVYRFPTDILQQSQDIVAIIRATTQAESMDPKGMWRAALAMIYEWAALLDEWFHANRHPEVQATRAILEYSDFHEPRALIAS